MSSSLNRITDEQKAHLRDYAEKKFRNAAEDVAAEAYCLLRHHGAAHEDITIEVGDWLPLFVAADRGKLTVSIDESIQLEPQE